MENEVSVRFHPQEAPETGDFLRYGTWLPCMGSETSVYVAEELKRPREEISPTVWVENVGVVFWLRTYHTLALADLACTADDGDQRVHP